VSEEVSKAESKEVSTYRSLALSTLQSSPAKKVWCTFAW